MILKQFHSTTMIILMMMVAVIQIFPGSRVLAQEAGLPTWVTNPPAPEEGEILAPSTGESYEEEALGLALAGMIDYLLAPTENGNFIMPGVLLSGSKPMIGLKRRMTEETLMMGTSSNIYKEMLSLTIVMNEEEYYYGEFEFNYSIHSDGEANTRTLEVYRHSGTIDASQAITLLTDEGNKELRYFAYGDGEQFHGLMKTTEIRFMKGTVDFDPQPAKEIFSIGQ